MKKWQIRTKNSLLLGTVEAETAQQALDQFRRANAGNRDGLLAADAWPLYEPKPASPEPEPAPKRRGRPVGSKNRPKPVPVTQHPGQVLEDGNTLALYADKVDGVATHVATLTLSPGFTVISQDELDSLRLKAINWDRLMKQAKEMQT